MPIFLLMGQDQYQIQQQIIKLKARLNSDWIAFNAHTYSAEQLSDAIVTAQTLPVFDDRRLVLVEDCQFNQFTDRQFELLKSLTLPSQTILVFTGRSIDKRLKVVKQLLKLGKLQEFESIPPWRMDLIESEIALQARQHNLRLSQPAIAYLATAIGNDRARIDAELMKLAIYAHEKLLTLIDAQQLVSAAPQNTLKLAEAIRTGSANQVIHLLVQMLSKAESPLLILATMIAQFRTWLWVKSALSVPATLNDTELARYCNISNPKRLYYLRQEVSTVPVDALIQGITELFNLESRLKQGESSEIMLSILIKITRSFNSTNSLSSL